MQKKGLKNVMIILLTLSMIILTSGCSSRSIKKYDADCVEKYNELVDECNECIDQEKECAELLERCRSNAKLNNEDMKKINEEHMKDKAKWTVGSFLTGLLIAILICL